MRLRLVILLLVGLLAHDALAGSVNATYVSTGILPGTGMCISNSTAIIFSEQGILIAAVVTLTIVIIAVAYMIGSSMGNTNYVVFAKDEMYHLMFSLVLLAGFSFILVLSCTIMQFFYSSTFSSQSLSNSLKLGCYTPGADMNNVSNCYMNIVQSNAQNIAQDYINNHIKYLMDSTFSWSIQIPLVDSYTITGASYKRIISNQYDMILNSFLIPALVSISMQKLLLNFINENAVRWILPIAFLLRIFIPTRQMGNVLIGLSLGLYIIVPFMYVFTLSMYDALQNTCATSNSYANAACDSPIDSYSCPVTNAIVAGQVCTNPDGFWNVASLVPQAFFLPNLTLVVLITFFGCMNKALKVIG